MTAIRFGVSLLVAILIAAPPAAMCVAVAQQRDSHRCCPPAWTTGSPDCCQFRDAGPQSSEPPRFQARGLSPSVALETAPPPVPAPERANRWVPVDRPPPPHAPDYLLNSVFRL